METVKHKIEDGIPMPVTRGGGPRTELGKLLNAMQPGQSFLTNKHRATIYSLARFYKIPVSVRAEGDQLRVWRLDISETNNEQKGEQQ